MIATLECTIGILLLANRGMRLAIWLLAIEFVGILLPIVLLAGRLFAGPHNPPTLTGQYCLKDIILVAANHISEADFYEWRETSIAAAALALTDDTHPRVRNDRNLELTPSQ